MKKNMKRLFLLTLVLLLVLSGGVLAQAPDSAAEEVVLVANLAAFKETGELFEGVKPGMSLEEVLATGLPLKVDTWHVGMLSEDSALFESQENLVVMMEGIRLDRKDIGTFSCLFHSGALCSMALYLGESMPLEEVLPIFTAVLGEPSNQNIVENQTWSLYHGTQTYETTNMIWEFDLNGEILHFSFSAYDYGEGASVGYFSATYMNYL